MENLADDSGSAVSQQQARKQQAIIRKIIEGEERTKVLASNRRKSVISEFLPNANPTYVDDAFYPKTLQPRIRTMVYEKIEEVSDFYNAPNAVIDTLILKCNTTIAIAFYGSFQNPLTGEFSVLLDQEMAAYAECKKHWEPVAKKYFATLSDENNHILHYALQDWPASDIKEVLRLKDRPEDITQRILILQSGLLTALRQGL